jgi:hypothetical protein
VEWIIYPRINRSRCTDTDGNVVWLPQLTSFSSPRDINVCWQKVSSNCTALFSCSKPMARNYQGQVIKRTGMAYHAFCMIIPRKTIKMSAKYIYWDAERSMQHHANGICQRCNRISSVDCHCSRPHLQHQPQQHQLTHAMNIPVFMHQCVLKVMNFVYKWKNKFSSESLLKQLLLCCQSHFNNSADYEC